MHVLVAGTSLTRVGLLLMLVCVTWMEINSELLDERSSNNKESYDSAELSYARLVAVVLVDSVLVLCTSIWSDMAFRHG